MEFHNQEINQNFWQLASIQTSSLGFSGIILSRTLSEKYGSATSILSILISNLILWFIGFVIVSMSTSDRRNAIENAAAYLGKYGTKFVALISITSFSIWYFLQIQEATVPINKSIFVGQAQNELIVSIYGVFLGIVISLLTLRNLMRLIKKMCIWFLPILILFHLYVFFFKSHISFPKSLTFSLPCTTAYVSFLFAGMVNLPTFFRHSRSKYDSYLALTLMTLINILFQISTVGVSSDILSGSWMENTTFFLNSSFIPRIFYVGFACSLLFINNLVNIYFASPSWELFFPKIKKHYEFFIIGLFGTFIYWLSRLFPKYSVLMSGFLNVADLFIANLGVVLLVMFGYRFIIRHRPKPFIKIFSSISWMVGCTITVIATFKAPGSPPLLTGTGVTILFFLLFIFIEEPIWSIKKLKARLDKKSNA